MNNCQLFDFLRNVRNFTDVKSVLSNLFKTPVASILEGFTDWHSHILPGVDDGCRTMEESLSLLSLYEGAGIRSVCLTPHIMMDMPNQTDELKSLFEQLRRRTSGLVHLTLASENMLDFLFGQRLEAKDLLLLSGRRVLVETSLYNPPSDFDACLRKIRGAGFVPVLAHPERYMYMDEKTYLELHGSGILFQTNLSSLAGMYGEEVKERAEMLISSNLSDIFGTDVHNAGEFRTLSGAYVGRRFADKIISR